MLTYIQKRGLVRGADRHKRPPGALFFFFFFFFFFLLLLHRVLAKVLHGAVRLHGLASSPTPETQVRVAWLDAGALVQQGGGCKDRAEENFAIGHANAYKQIENGYGSYYL